MAALAFLRHWKLIGLGLVCLLLAFSVVRGNHFRNQRDEARIHLNECREGRKQDRARYEQAQRDAAAKNRAENERIISEQERNNEASERDTINRLERLRRELRGEGKAVGGSTNRPGTGSDGKAPANPDGSARLCPSPEELLRAAENEERHDQLITWIEKQLGVKR